MEQEKDGQSKMITNAPKAEPEIPEYLPEFLEAISFNPNYRNKKFSYAYTEDFLLADFRKDPLNTLEACEHSHSAYEFFIPTTTIPYLTNEDAVYFGEVGMAYPVDSGRRHGMKYSLSNVGVVGIAIGKAYFENMLAEKGHSDFEFNDRFKCSELMRFIIKAFISEFEKKEQRDEKYKLNAFRDIICSELIDLATGGADDEKKNGAIYQKGIQTAVQYINDNYAENISVEELAALCGFSVSYFSSCFKNSFGESPKAYITRIRISKAKTLLEFSDCSISDVSEQCGFQHKNTFSTAFRTYVKLSPSAYRNLSRKGQGDKR